MATVNYIPEHKQSPSAMRAVMDYCRQKFKVHDPVTSRDLVSGVHCSGENAYDEFMLTKQVYGKTGGVNFYQYTQSFDSLATISSADAHALALKFAERAWPGHEVLVCTHCDTDNPHTHFVINSVGWESGRKLRQSPRTIERLRELSDAVCLAHGCPVLPPKSQPTVKGVSAREYRSAAKGQSWKFQLMAAVDDCMIAARSRRDFIERMRRKGYEVRWENGRANITYTTPSGVKCRDRKLHEEKYLKENMEHEFNIRKELIAGRAEGLEPPRPVDGERGRDAHHGGVSGLAGAARSDGQDTRRAPQDERAAVRAADEGRRGGDPENAGADARSGAASGETGWEKERKSFLAYLAGGQGLAGGSSPDAVVVVAGSDPAGRSGISGVVLREPSAGRSRADTPVSAIVRLGREAEAAANTPPVYDATMRPEHIDSKRRRALQEKRVALGHKPDDHEEPSNNHHQQQM